MASIYDPDPNVTFKLSSRKRRKDEFVVGDTYDNFQTAKDFAKELATTYKHYQCVICNSKGVLVYDTRNPSDK